jgi:hypothetical protein
MHSIFRSPGFAGVREQVESVRDLCKSEWKRSRNKSEPMFEIPQRIGYVRRLRDTEQRSSMVLGNAAGRAAAALGLNGRALAQIVGFSEATVSSIVHGDRGIDPASKEGHLSLMLIRVFRSLDALAGGDDGKRLTWMSTHNTALNGVPESLILSAEGLERTLAYLDSMRAPI